MRQRLRDVKENRDLVGLETAKLVNVDETPVKGGVV
jgi:hypothetical protein